jgi:hypothetical protein
VVPCVPPTGLHYEGADQHQVQPVAGVDLQGG